MRLGDLDALKKSLNFVYDCTYIGSKSKEGIVSDIIEEIDNAPTVDLKDIYQEGHYDGHLEGYTKAINEERPQGKWIRNEEIDKRTGELHPITFGGIVIYTCSICGSSEWGGNFCPNCGARMEVKNNGQI